MNQILAPNPTIAFSFPFTGFTYPVGGGGIGCSSVDNFEQGAIIDAVGLADGNIVLKSATSAFRLEPGVGYTFTIDYNDVAHTTTNVLFEIRTHPANSLVDSVNLPAARQITTLEIVNPNAGESYCYFSIKASGAGNITGRLFSITIHRHP